MAYALIREKVYFISLSHWLCVWFLLKVVSGGVANDYSLTVVWTEKKGLFMVSLIDYFIILSHFILF